jgi:hypothetical protein
VPILGLTIAIISIEVPIKMINVFIIGFRDEILGLSLSKLGFKKNNFCVFVFHTLSKINNMAIRIISKNNQDHDMFSSSYII